MPYIIAYFATLITFLVLDAIWLTKVMQPMFQKQVGALLRSEIMVLPAAGFYGLYIVGILYFASFPGLKDGPLWVVINSAFLGFLCYGTYEATNMTTLKGWSWHMVFVDTAWGMGLTVVSALAGWVALRAMLPAG